LHQLDIITPLYITGYGKVVSVNRIDVYGGDANLEQYDSKNTESVLDFIVKDWQEYGIPKYLQVDNEAAFKGGLCHPKTFGKLVRFCLNFGVQMIFIPFKEPWRNGHIESFNDRFETLVWYRYRYHNLEHLRTESRKFREQHNEYQAYKKHEFGKTYAYPFTRSFLPNTFRFDHDVRLPITTGLIHFIRLVNDEGMVSILNEQFTVGSKYSFEYVWAVLNTRDETLSFYYKATKETPKELIKTERYKLRETVRNRIPVNHFCQ
jgi:putative transposase